MWSPGILAEQFVADGPRFQLYNSTEKHWDDLMNWQHSTMYLFFGLAAAVCLIIHTTEAAPLALDRLMLATAFFNEGKKRRVQLHQLHLFPYVLVYDKIINYLRGRYLSLSALFQLCICCFQLFYLTFNFFLNV